MPYMVKQTVLFTFSTVNQAFQFLAVSAGINAVVFSGIILWRKKASVAAVFLCLVLLGISLQSILNAFDNRDFFWRFPHLLKISWINPQFFSACIFLFVKYLTRRGTRFNPKDLLYFAPFMVYVLLLAPFFLQSATEKRIYIDDFDKASVDDFGILPQLNMLLVGGFMVLSLLRISRYRRRLVQYYSSTDKRKLQWLSAFIWATLGIFALSVLVFFARKWQVAVIRNFYHYNYLLVVALVYWTGIRFLTRPALFGPMKMKVPAGNTPSAPIEEPEGEEEPETETEKTFRMHGAEAETLRQNLQRLMEAGHVYRNPELDIYTLADLLGEKRHRVSYVINTLEGKNFFDYVNGYRVNEVKRLLGDPAKQPFTILALALEAGFNSKSTFNHIFKKQTGLSPSEYRKTHLQ